MSDTHDLLPYLTVLTNPHSGTANIQAAEAHLKTLLKSSNASLTLLQLSSHADVTVRQVAAVLLRKRLPQHLNSLPPATQAQAKTELLSRLAQEPERAVRLSLIGVVAAVAKQHFATYPELLTFLTQLSTTNSSIQAHETLYLLLHELTEVLGDHPEVLVQQLNLNEMLIAGLNAQEEKVASAAVKATGSYISFFADEHAGILNLLTPLLQTSTRLSSGNTDNLALVLDVLYDMSFLASELNDEIFMQILSFSLECVGSEQVELGQRDAAALVIASFVEVAPKRLQKNVNFVNALTQTLLQIMSGCEESAAGALFENNPHWLEDYEGPDDHDDGDEPQSLMSVAQGTLDALALNLNSKLLFGQVMNLVKQMVAEGSNNEHVVKAALSAIGVIAEGTSTEFLKAGNNLREIVSVTLQHCSSNSGKVKEACCFTLGQLAEHLQPEILGYSDEVLPVLLSLLDDSSETVKVTACYVLEMFCERMEPEKIRAFLNVLVTKLAILLEHSNRRSIQEMSVAALAACAVGAEDDFIPYLPQIARLLEPCLNLNEEKLFSLRGRALECMGHIAIAVGTDQFRPYFNATVQSAASGLSTGNTDLAEFAYAAFANLSKVMKSEMTPFLGDLVPHLLQVISSDEGAMELKESTSNNNPQAAAAAFGNLDDSDDEDEDDAGNYTLHVRTAMLDAKKGAITAIGEMAAYCGASFVPYLEESMKALTKICSMGADSENGTASEAYLFGLYSHGSIISEAADALGSMPLCSIAANHGGEVSWEKGDVTSSNPMSQHTYTVVCASLKCLVALLQNEDKEVVSKAAESIQKIIESCGPHALIAVAQECLSHTLDLLKKKAPCQAHEAEDVAGADAFDFEDDHENYMVNVCDLVGGFSRVMGHQFAPYLGDFLPPICAFGKSSSPASDRGMAMGCLGEIAQECGGASISPHWESIFFPAILAGLNDSEKDHNVMRNAAFMCGICCEVLGENATSRYLELLQGLSPLFSLNIDESSTSKETTEACMDNAAAAVARMIMASAASVPLAEVFPIFLSVLPLKNDMTENETVYKCIGGLIQMGHEVVNVNKNEITRVLQGAMRDERVEDSVKQSLSSLSV